MRLAPLFLAAALVLSGCGSASDSLSSPSSSNDASVERAELVPDVRKSPIPVEQDNLSAAAAPKRRAAADAGPSENPTMHSVRLARGIDVSHHQGAIDWEQVAGDRIEFAWLKATEGTGFVDQRYVANRDAAREAGLRVGAYHYFSICGEGAPQAEHFVRVVGKLSDTVRDLPPAVDVELDADCDPTRDELLSRLRDFIKIAEEGTGRTVIVYAFPDLEERYDIAEALERPLWVRNLGKAQPQGNWMVWQKSQTATVAGINGGVDLDLMRQ